MCFASRLRGESSVKVELHQLELRYAGLRVLTAASLSRLVASLAQHGQRSALLVVAEGEHRYVLIDGYARVEALIELGRDDADAVVLDVGEPEALVLAHRLETKRRRSALEEGWLIAELTERHGWSHRVTAERLHRSASWVCRRLALVRTLPEVAQEATKRGRIPAHAAAKYLVPLARANAGHCEQIVDALGDVPVSVRQVERLYMGYKRGDSQTRERIAGHPRLFLDADAATLPEPPLPAGDPAEPLVRDIEGIDALARRARRRVRDGLLLELDDARRSVVCGLWRGAACTVDTLSKMLEATVP